MTSTDNLTIIGPAIDDVRSMDNRLTVSGRLVRIARPRSETFDPLDDPELFLSRVRESRVRADLFTFSQRFSEPTPRYTHHCELEPVAILEVENYEKWWKQTINDKTRNMVRKAAKKGVLIDIVNYSDELVGGIKQIYDECPVRQGKKSRHYGKCLELLKSEHATFLDKSEFVAAHLGNRLIGFAKVVFQKDFASIMNIIALISERDKAPNNALLAKVVERCAAKGVRLLHYGVWGHRGFSEFKVHQGFKCRLIPRYYVPLTAKGALALQLALHRPVTSHLPESCLDWFATLRARWYAWRYPLK